MSPGLNRAPFCLALACLSMAGAAAHAGDTVTISITHNDTDDIACVRAFATRPCRV